MDFNDCLSALKRRFMLIVIITVFAAMSAWVTSRFLIKCVYEAKSTILISWANSQSSSNKTRQQDILLSSNYIHICYDLSQSVSVAESVIKRLQLCIPVEKLKEFISVDVDFETGIIKVTARTNCPELSKTMVEAFVESLNCKFTAIVSCAEMQTIDAPKLPKRPASPNIALNILLSCVGGFMAGILLVILFQAKDQCENEIYTLCRFPSLPVLGYLPKIRRCRKHAQQIFCLTNPVFNQSVKLIRANLLRIMDCDSIKTVLVTSPRRCEGKTTVAANIAVSMAKARKRVLLLDCNCHNPSLYRLFCSNSPMTVTYPAGQGEKNTICVYHFARTDVDLVADIIVPQELSEGACPSGLLSFIEAVEHNYDIILLDCPSLLHSAYTLTLSTLVDGVIIIADYCRLDHSVLKKCLQGLKQFRTKMVGIVVNKMPPSRIL